MEQEKPTKPETDRTFPEDDDTLYREMTVHMPRCYFPTSLGENSILKFAGEGIPPRQEYCLPALQLNEGQIYPGERRRIPFRLCSRQLRAGSVQTSP